MKNFKKITFAVLALAPLLAVLAFVIGNVGNQGGVEYVPLGTVSIEMVENGAIFSCTPDSWADRVLTPLIGENAVSGFYGAIGRLLVSVESQAGFPVSFPVVLAIFYAAYLFVLELLNALSDLLLFVPRKVSEVFR